MNTITSPERKRKHIYLNESLLEDAMFVKLSGGAFRLWVEAACMRTVVVIPEELPHFKAKALRELLGAGLLEKIERGVLVHGPVLRGIRGGGADDDDQAPGRGDA